MPGNIIRVLVEGESRGRIKRITQETPFFKADIEETIFELAKGKEVDALSHMIMDIFQDYMKLSRKVSPETLLTISNMEDYGKVADIIAGNIDLKLEEQQEILEILPPYERLEFLYGKLIQEMEILRIERNIDEKVRSQIDRVQKEYYLREQMKVIQEELGEDESVTTEIQEYRSRMDELELEGEVREKVEKEISRLSKLPSGSAEVGVIRTYIEWILDLLGIRQLRTAWISRRRGRFLEEEHYALEKVKERVLEYLAVLQLSKSLKGPILCLVGPPGVGNPSPDPSPRR